MLHQIKRNSALSKINPCIRPCSLLHLPVVRCKAQWPTTPSLCWLADTEITHSYTYCNRTLFKILWILIIGRRSGSGIRIRIQFLSWIRIQIRLFLRGWIWITIVLLLSRHFRKSHLKEKTPYILKVIKETWIANKLVLHKLCRLALCRWIQLTSRLTKLRMLFILYSSYKPTHQGVKMTAQPDRKPDWA